MISFPELTSSGDIEIYFYDTFSTKPILIIPQIPKNTNIILQSIKAGGEQQDKFVECYLPMSPSNFPELCM